MSQMVGGHSPTKMARRSALPRSSWSTVFARIHSPMHSPIAAMERICACAARSPTRWRVVVSIARWSAWRWSPLLHFTRDRER
jgi:hypothetical protein